MQTGRAAPASRGATSDLPLLFRLAARGRRVLGESGTRLIHRTPVIAPLRRALSGAAPHGPAMVEVCGGRLRGMRMLVDLSCEKYYWLGTHEEPVQEWFALNVGPGSTVYDVGAHAGFFSLLCAVLAGPSGLVHAFEPRAENVERLRANVRANFLDTVEIHAAAVSDSVGHAAFVTHASTLEGRLAAGRAGSVPVPTTTIDACVDGGMAPPNFVKVDVEGAEGAVIRGAARTITVHEPMLLLEIHSADAGREVAEALPCPYEFEDVRSGRRVAYPPPAGHFVARPAAR